MHPVQGAVAALGAAIAMGVAAPAAAQAPQKFPSKPVRIVVGFSPGSTTDITARMIGPRRSPLLPNVPAMAEILPEFQRDAAHALMAPSRTPDALVRKISADVARVLDLPDVKERMASMSFDPAPTSPEEYDRIRARRSTSSPRSPDRRA